MWRLGQTPGANSARTNASRRRGSAGHPSLEIAAVADVPHDSGVKLLIRYASSGATGCQLGKAAQRARLLAPGPGTRPGSVGSGGPD